MAEHKDGVMQFADGVKWFAGMSSLLVVGSMTVMDKIQGVAYRDWLFCSVLSNVVSMVVAGFQLINLSFVVTSLVNNPDKLRWRKTRMLYNIQLGSLSTALICAAIAIWGLAASPVAGLKK